MMFHFSTAYQKQTNDLSEWTIKILDDMLQSFVIDFSGSWDSYLPLAEFSYYNNYHFCVGALPFELLYGRKCCIWFVGGRLVT